MEQKAIQLQNRGMNRDLSISKASNEYAFENHNIRITARDHDTLLSVTNERGNKKVTDLPSFPGTLVGWNVLNKYLILFTVETAVPNNLSTIYRVEYTGTGFTYKRVFRGDLGFDADFPIESVVDFETEDSQKIYWVDGKNVLRFLNFSDTYLQNHCTEGWNTSTPVFTFHDDNTWFDSTRPTSTTPSIVITKDNGGNTRANGVAQYFLTYYNKNAQQTGIVWSSPLVYLSPSDRGGAADGNNTNRITLTMSNLDKQFEYVRLYQIVRTSYNASASAFLVGDVEITDGNAVIVDDGAHLTSVDLLSFLYLGSQEVKASTLTHKDNTLFLGDLRSVGNDGIDALEQAIDNNAFILAGSSFAEGTDWESAIVRFQYSDTSDTSKKTNHIPYILAQGYYPYKSELNYTNAQVSTFKGGEKYRFGLQFFRGNGVASKVFWIGDKVNRYYPKMQSGTTVKRAIAVCEIPSAIVNAARNAGFAGVELMIAQATYADRSVKAQGIVSPTMFNTYYRHLDEPFSQASWNYRPKHGNLPYMHFSSTLRSDKKYAELQTSWWESATTSPKPFYYTDSNGELVDKPMGYKTYGRVKVDVDIDANTTFFMTQYSGSIRIRFYSENDQHNAYDVLTYDKTFSLGGESVGENSIKSLMKDWLYAYNSAEVPAECRATSAEMRDKCNEAKSANNHHADYDTDDSDLENTVDNINSSYSKYNREYFFVDENIVTLNSPEIDYGVVSLDGSDLSFRIVGASKMSSNITDYTIEADTFLYSGTRVPNYIFSNSNEFQHPTGLVSWPLYKEYGYKKSGTVQKVSEPYSFMTYLWHKSGSIPNFDYGTEGLKSILSSKRFANLHYAHYSFFNDYGSNEWSVTPNSLRQVDPLTASLYNVKTVGGTRTYLTDVDQLISMPGDTKYPIFYSDEEALPGKAFALDHIEDLDSAEPVRLTYITKPHALITLPRRYGKDCLIPSLFSTDIFKLGSVDQTYNGPYLPWISDTISYGALLYWSVNGAGVGAYNAGIYEGFEQKTDGIFRRETVEDGLAGAVSDIKDRTDVANKTVYLPTTVDSTGRYLLDYLSFYTSETTASAGWYGEWFSCRISSGIPMASIQYSVVGVPASGSEVSLAEDTVVFSSSGVTSHDINVLVTGNWASIKIGYKVIYTWTYLSDPSDPESTTHVVPTLDNLGSSSNWLTGVVYGPSNVVKTDCKYELFYNTSYIDIDSVSEDTSFFNISDAENRIFTLHVVTEGSDPENYFTDDGFYSSIFHEPEQLLYTMPSDSLIKEGDEYLLLGELYKDYDALARSNPSLDTRYGGIKKSDVQGNTFIKASSRVQLSSTISIDTYAQTALDLSGLLAHMSHLSVGESFSMKLKSSEDKLLQEIDLPNISNLSIYDIELPTYASPTANLTVERVAGTDTYKSVITGMSNTVVAALMTGGMYAAEYKICVLRLGYARRGVWKKYVNKYGQLQSSHTIRDKRYKFKRRGYANSLDAKRFRILGFDQLISGKTPAELLALGSHTYEQAKYYNATLITNLEDMITLPALSMTQEREGHTTDPNNHLITRDNRFSNSSQYGLTDLYIGLYHLENKTWKLVSNIVKVRSRDANKKNIWEFEETNIQYSLDSD